MIVTYGSENKRHKLIFNKLSCYPQESLHLEEHFSFDLVAQSLSWFLFKRFCTFSFVIFFFLPSISSFLKVLQSTTFF